MNLQQITRQDLKKGEKAGILHVNDIKECLYEYCIPLQNYSIR